MAVNPFNAMNAISGANDEIEEPDCKPATGGASDCSFDPNTNITGVYVTADDGGSWSHQVLHWGSFGFVSDGDPIVAFGPKPIAHGFSPTVARAYFAPLAHVPSAGPNQELVAVSHSDDGGMMWSGPVLASDKINPVSAYDKDAVWADASSSSPHFGSVYVSWTLFKGAVGVPEPIMIARSTDGGMTFQKPRQVTASSDSLGAGGRQGSTIRTAPDGTVYVFWEGTFFRHSAIMGARSTDGGVSFSRPFFIAFVNDLPIAFPGSTFRTNSYPLADIAPNGNVFIVWGDYSAGHAVVKLAKWTNGGASWTTSTAANVSGRSAFYPAVAAFGTKVFIGFSAIDDKPAGTAPGAGVVTYDSYYVLSSSNGSAGSFTSPPVKISAASSDPDASTANALTDQFIGDYNGAAASPDGTFWYAWTDTRGGSPCPAVDKWRAGTGSKPNIYDSCSGSFGNSDIRVAHVTP